MQNHYKRGIHVATKKEKEEMLEILKFVPLNVTVYINGYGGECYIGKVSRETYEYFKSKKIDIEQYASDWDGLFDDVPAEHKFFEPGSPYECDNLMHGSGATMDDTSTISIEDANGNVIWSSDLTISTLIEKGVQVDSSADDYDSEDEEDGTVLFWGGQGEKGCFFVGEFVLTSPFDPTKLRISYANGDGWFLSNSVEYDGEELDGSSGYSTTGKWTEHKFWIAGGEEVYIGKERGEDEDEEDQDTEEDLNEILKEFDSREDDRSPWFNSDDKPLIKGEYEIFEKGSAWPFPQRAEWTGRSWKLNGKKVSIEQWRGLNYNPEEVRK